MPLYDYECPSCGAVTEHIAETYEEFLPCPKCKNLAERIISVSGVNTANEDADWIRSVTEVVDKEGGEHCQRFLKNPTRSNMRNWMRKEGLRHLEPGETQHRRPPQTEGPSTDKLMRELQKARRLEVRNR